jgi:hypothetical protein
MGNKAKAESGKPTGVVGLWFLVFGFCLGFVFCYLNLC